MSEIPLSKTTKFIVDNRGRTAPTVSKGIPLIATNCINNNSLYPLYENLRYVSKETYETWFRSHPEPGDIILTLKGSQNGAVCLVPNPVDFVIAQDMVALRADENIIDPLFLFAALRSSDVQIHIKNLDVSGVIPHLKKSDFDKLLIPYPEKNKQIAIGSIYFNISKKIDLLQRQNWTLEGMAETLFRQFLIEEVKESWESRALSSVADFLNGLACQKFPPKNDVDMLPVLKIKELSGGISANSDWASTDIGSEYIIKNGDVIFAWSASLMVKIWNGEDCILNQHLFKVTSANFPKWYYYLWCKHHLAEFIAKAASHATTMGHIKRGDLDLAIVLVPSPEELGEMTKVIGPIIDKIIVNNTQIRTLTLLRDPLLPKMMNGEITIESD